MSVRFPKEERHYLGGQIGDPTGRNVEPWL